MFVGGQAFAMKEKQIGDLAVMSSFLIKRSAAALAPSALQQRIRNLTVCIYGAPQPVFLSLDCHHRLIELPYVDGPHLARTF